MDTPKPRRRFLGKFVATLGGIAAFAVISSPTRANAQWVAGGWGNAPGHRGYHHHRYVAPRYYTPAPIYVPRTYAPGTYYAPVPRVYAPAPRLYVPPARTYYGPPAGYYPPMI